MGWYLFVYLHTPPSPLSFLSPALFLGLLDRFLHPYPYPFSPLVTAVASGLDLLALVGIVTALVWAFHRVRGRAWTPVTVAIYLFAILTAALAKGELWTEVYGFGRTLSPLLLLCALDGLTRGSLIPSFGMLAVAPRIVLQWADQILGVARRLVEM